MVRLWESFVDALDAHGLLEGVAAPLDRIEHVPLQLQQLPLAGCGTPLAIGAALDLPPL